MPTSIRPIRVNHMNVIWEDFEGSVAHLKDLFGAEFVVDIPQPEWHAYLFNMGGVLFEAFVPHLWLLNSRFGPNYLGLEYQADMEVTRAAIAERGIRIARDIGLAVHTHPQDTFGVSFEFYDGEFHTRHWDLLNGPPAPAEKWRDHPTGLTGQKGYTHVVRDLPACVAFLKSFLSADQVYEADRPAIGGKAVGLKIADVTVEVQTPSGDGALAQHLGRYGDGIRTTQFTVRDLGKAKSYFEGRGVGVVAGDTPDSFALAPKDNLGTLFEFSA